MQNAIPGPTRVDVADAHRPRAPWPSGSAEYAERGPAPARRRARGDARGAAPTSRPRVADIVAAAGLSNDAFYRHFASKDALVAAILEDGMRAPRAATWPTRWPRSRPAERKVRRWVEGVLSQATDEEVASSTLAVLWNASQLGATDDATRPRRTPTWPACSWSRCDDGLLGSRLDATLLSHAVLGTLSDYLWQRARPSTGDRARGLLLPRCGDLARLICSGLAQRAAVALGYSARPSAAARARPGPRRCARRAGRPSPAALLTARSEKVTGR